MKDKVILIDAFSQIFRCFYAVRYLSNPKGEPTNAIFALTRLLIQLEKNYPCSLGLFAFDCGKPAFRLALAPEYKANRPPMPEDLAKQLPTLRRLIELFGWNILEEENYEADDLIGALALYMGQNNHAVQIISSDKDLSQLINDKVTMLIPDRTGGGFEERTAEHVNKKFQVPPEKIVDYLAIIGDSSDNIAGIKGMGPKTAAKILNEASSLQAIFEHPEIISNEKWRNQIIANRQLLENNIKLITLRDDLPGHLLPVDEIIIKKSPNWEAISEICVENELKSILKELPTAATPAKDMFADDLFGDNF